MKRRRKNKAIIIIALIISIIGMSIGFAVFSNVLTISSSATVTPSEDDFKISVYGLVDSGELNSLMNDESYIPDLTKWSTTTAYQLNSITPSVFESNQYNATINNSGDELRIQNITGNFTSPGAQVAYVFTIKNEGAYDVYFNESDETASLTTRLKSCVPGEGATPILVEAACNEIYPIVFFFNSSGEEIKLDVNSNYKINVGDYITMQFLTLYFNDIRADGPFTVEFVDFKYEFSTAPKS